jgi:hypothetical protein
MAVGVQQLVVRQSVTVKPTVATGLTYALCFSGKKPVTAWSGSLAYIRPHPGSFVVTKVREKLPTL